MITAILAFLFEWRFVITVIAIVGLYALFCWSNFKAKAYAIMLQAKSLAKDAVLKSGQEQEDFVVNAIYRFSPKIFSLVPEAFLRRCVHYLFIKGKDYLDNGILDGSID